MNIGRSGLVSIIAGGVIVMTAGWWWMQDSRRPRTKAAASTPAPPADDFGLSKARKVTGPRKIDPRLLARKGELDDTPAKLIARYSAARLPDRIAALRYLSDESPWNDRDRAWLLDVVLRDPVEELRMAALLQVENDYFDTALPLLERTLRDNSPDVRAMAVDALAASDDLEAIPVLERALADSQNAVRMRVLDAIAPLGVEWQRPILFAAMNSTDDEVAVAAIQSLWAVATPEILPEVIRLMGSPSPVRREAAQDFISALSGSELQDEDAATEWLAANQESLTELLATPPEPDLPPNLVGEGLPPQ